MRLGLFGGRFDPVHVGHLMVAQNALEVLGLDELWFIPAKTPPHKDTAAAAEERYEMLLLATNTHPRFRVSRLEIERTGASYTFDTVAEVRAQMPDAELFFITGVDAYAQIATWHRARELVSNVSVVALGRPGYSLEGLDPYFRERVHVLETPLWEVSSTAIRRRLARRESVRYLVPEPVERYLAKNPLYHQQPLHQN